MFFNTFFFFLTYFFFFKNLALQLTFLDIFFFVVFYCLFCNLTLLIFQYLYFFSILFLFFFIAFVGWNGFTLSFLILLILYSTLVIVFWCFFIAFEDQKKKKERIRSSFFFLIFFLPLIFQSSLLFTPTPFSPLFAYNFYSQNDFSEFLTLFLLIYVFMPITSASIFLTLIFICFNIVLLLLLKKRSELTSSLKPFYFQARSSSPSVGFSSLRTSFWSTAATNLNFLSLTKNLK